MKISLKMGGKVYEANPNNHLEVNDLLNKLILFNSKTYPFFINMLLTICDIENVDEKHKKALAYTYPDYVNERIKIVVNFNKVAEYGFDDKELLFVIFHELLHNFFYHFERMKQESKISPQLANIVEDYYCNSMLFEMLNINPNNFSKYKIDLINYEKLTKIAGKQLPFSCLDECSTRT